MTGDSIIDEIRTLRDEIAKEYDYDIDAIFVAFRQMEAAGRGRHVTLARREVSDRYRANAVEVAAQPGVAPGGASPRR